MLGTQQAGDLAGTVPSAAFGRAHQAACSTSGQSVSVALHQFVTPGPRSWLAGGRRWLQQSVATAAGAGVVWCWRGVIVLIIAGVICCLNELNSSWSPGNFYMIDTRMHANTHRAPTHAAAGLQALATTASSLASTSTISVITHAQPHCCACCLARSRSSVLAGISVVGACSDSASVASPELRWPAARPAARAPSSTPAYAYSSSNSTSRHEAPGKSCHLHACKQHACLHGGMHALALAQRPLAPAASPEDCLPPPAPRRPPAAQRHQGRARRASRHQQLQAPATWRLRRQCRCRLHPAVQRATPQWRQPRGLSAAPHPPRQSPGAGLRRRVWLCGSGRDGHQRCWARQ